MSLDEGRCTGRVNVPVQVDASAFDPETERLAVLVPEAVVLPRVYIAVWVWCGDDVEVLDASQDSVYGCSSEGTHEMLKQAAQASGFTGVRRESMCEVACSRRSDPLREDESVCAREGCKENAPLGSAARH